MAETTVWYATIDDFASHRSRAAQVLSESELARALRYRRESDQLMSMLGRYILRTKLGANLGIDPHAIQLETNEFGKPRIVEHFNADWSFNLSHSGGMVIVGFAHRFEIGVDVEEVRPMPDWQAIANVSYASTEYDYLLRLTDANRDQEFFKIWTCKEAYIKAIGKGMSLPLKSFAIVPTASNQPKIQLANTGSASDVWSVCQFSIGSNYQGAISANDSSVLVRIRRFDFDDVLID